MRRLLTIGLGMALLAGTGLAWAEEGGADPAVLRQIEACQKLTPLQMAQSSRLVNTAYNFVFTRARAITNPDLRQAVLGMLENPSPTSLGSKKLTEKSFLAASGGGWLGHHAYPGGLAVHTAANLHHALNIVGVYRELYGATLDEGLITGAVIMHDVLKSYTNQFYPRWDEQAGKFYSPPEVQAKGQFAAWGSFALMGHHNEMVVTELMFRDAPPALVFAAHPHQDQYWDSREHPWLKDRDETWERTVEDAIAALAKRPGQAERAQRYRALMNRPEYRNIETGINVLADKDWNITQGKAMPAALQVMNALADRYGLARDSRPYNMARNWLFSRLDPVAIMATMEREGLDGALKQAEAVFREPGKYEL